MLHRQTDGEGTELRNRYNLEAAVRAYCQYLRELGCAPDLGNSADVRIDAKNGYKMATGDSARLRNSSVSV